MASYFSGALQITDLDDFIAPSQECVKPIEIKKADKASDGLIRIQKDGSYVEEKKDGSKRVLQRAQITLNDCLACSGCITSAEHILITQQSSAELLKVLAENESCSDQDPAWKLVVVSLSLQSILSLAQKYALEAQECAKKICGYLKKKGVHRIYDISTASEISLRASTSEFIERWKKRDEDPFALPMLSSACPGWVCYAEKTHGNFILPYIARAKSPQQIMGSIVKGHLARNIFCKKTNQIFHVTVMPCFDKKLEASRPDFASPIQDDGNGGIRDVDCVLTSIEIQDMILKDGVDLTLVDPENLDEIIPCPDAPIPDHDYTVLGRMGSSSGGFLHRVFLRAAKTLFDTELDTVELKQIRNQDFQETILEKNDQAALHFALAYGFNNIQNMIQKLKRKKAVGWQYVEVMACPSGCVNGGAQIRPDNDEVKPRELASTLSQKYAELPKWDDVQDALVDDLLKAWLDVRHPGDLSKSNPKTACLFTEYHAVPKMVNALSIKW